MAQELDETESWTPEQHRAFFLTGAKPGGDVSPIVPALAAATERRTAEQASAKPPQDTSYGMSGLGLAMAGAGGEANDIYQGLKEKGQIAFRPEGEAGQALLKQIAQDRAERAALHEQLYNNPSANFGKFGLQAATAAAAPARLGAQMALQGGLGASKAGSQAPGGIGAELINSALHGGQEALAMGVVGKGVQALGKTLGATTGNYTQGGLEAIRTKLAAERLGLPATSTSQLFPNSASGRVVKSFPGYDDKVLEQALALRNRLDKPIIMPEKEISNMGGKFLEELQTGVKNRLQLGSDKYDAVDALVQDKGLKPLSLLYTSRTAASTKHPGYEEGSQLLKDYGFDVPSLAGQDPRHLASLPATFAQLHEGRIAVNKAINTVDRDIASAPNKVTPAMRQKRDYLREMKAALDNDAERWGNQNSGNKEALDLYKDATKYYREVVAPTVLENHVARKAVSRFKGFDSGQQALGMATSKNGEPLTALIEPTMSPNGQDLVQVLKGLPDVRKTALSQDLTPPPTQSHSLWDLARVALFHPFGTAEVLGSKIPGLHQLGESKVAARLAAAQDSLQEGASPLSRMIPAGVLPRAAYGASQYVRPGVEKPLKRYSENR